eukprot:scaffold40430_cov26-Prasinocladus_malaysianus.AAC.3
MACRAGRHPSTEPPVRTCTAGGSEGGQSVVPPCPWQRHAGAATRPPQQQLELGGKLKKRCWLFLLFWGRSWHAPRVATLQARAVCGNVGCPSPK